MNLLSIEENLSLENDQMIQPAATKDNSKVDVEDDSPKEVWTMSEMKPSKAGSLTMLTMIGKFSHMITNFLHIALSEKKVLPLTVLFASIVYFAIAASFYF